MQNFFKPIGCRCKIEDGAKKSNDAMFSPIGSFDLVYLLSFLWFKIYLPITLLYTLLILQTM